MHVFYIYLYISMLNILFMYIHIYLSFHKQVKSHTLSHNIMSDHTYIILSVLVNLKSKQRYNAKLIPSLYNSLPPIALPLELEAK